MKLNRIILIIGVVIIQILPVSAQGKKDGNSLLVPIGVDYSILNDGNSGRTYLFTLPNGDVIMLNDSIMQIINDSTKYIVLPHNTIPIAMCATNEGRIIFQCRDTIYLMMESLRIYPLFHSSRPVKLRAIGQSDFAFLAIRDSCVYRYSFAENKIQRVFLSDDIINDFVVDGGDYYYLSDSIIMLYTEEKEYLPLLGENKTIYNVGISNYGLVLYSTEDGLWLVNPDRQKIQVYDYPVKNIVIDEYDRLFLKLLDGSWVYIHPFSAYLKLFE